MTDGKLEENVNKYGSPVYSSSCSDEGRCSPVKNDLLNDPQKVPDFSNPFLKMSKRKVKKMKISAERYLQLRRERRVLEKQRKKAKRAAIIAAGGGPPKRPKKHAMCDSKCKQRIAIDMSFYNKMSIRDVNRTISQLSFCYAANRRSPNPVQLTIAHLEGLQREMFFSNQTRHSWDVFIREENLSELYKPEDVVYLTADSENVLETLDGSKVYVIGGLLDHNACKNLCLTVAEEQKFAHARLPIDEYVRLNSRKVLTINQVFEILLHYLETSSWEDAFFKVIPKRKLKTEEDKTSNNKATKDDEKPLEASESEHKDSDVHIEQEDKETLC